MKTAVYVRVSTEEQVKEGFSIEGQKRRLTDFVSSQGWEIYDLYIDDGYSAKNLERPHMQRMIKDIKNGKLDVVLVYRLDRLVRSVLDLHELLQLFDEYNVKFKSATENYETTTAIGRLFITLVGAMAQWERENLAERVKMGMEQKFFKGERNGAVSPYGYDLENGKLVVNPEEAKIVKRVFKLYQTMGARAVAFTLNREGIPKRDTQWSYDAVRYIIMNPVYTGKLRWNYRKAGGELTGQEMIAEGTHEPIIEQELFDKTEKLRISRQKEGKKSTSAYPFTGVLRCGRCNHPMIGASKKRKEGRYRFYRCIGRFKYGICDMPIIAEESVTEAFLERFEYPQDIFNQEVAVTKQDDDDERVDIERELKQIAKRKKKWQTAYANDVISLEDLKSLTEEDRQREEHLKKALLELPEKEKPLSEEDFIHLITEVRTKWDKHDSITKKQFISSIFNKLYINTDVKEAKGGPGRKVPVTITNEEFKV